MDKGKLRSNLIKLMLGCLVAAAAVAIVTILIGQFNDTAGKSLGTVFSALLHIAVVFGLVSMTASRIDVSPKSTDFVINSSIVIAVLSFFTSVLGVWGVLSGDVALKLYTTYVVAIFALLHAKTLIDVEAVNSKVQPYVKANYVFMAVVAFMILGVVYSADGADLLSGFYGRLLAVSAIVDVTLSVVVVGIQRLYLQQHPEIILKEPGRAHGGSRVLVVLLLFFFVILPMLQLTLGLLLHL